MKTNFEKIRSQFCTHSQIINGKKLVYLDSAATTLKPMVVVERMQRYYLYETANVHRGAHYLSDMGTENFENARTKIAGLLGAESSDEIVFVRGTTEALNLVAQSYGETFLKPNDEILITEMEHHANIVPWQMLAEKKGLKISWVKVTDSGELDLEDLAKKLTSKTKIFAVTACSNTLGTLNDIPRLSQMTHDVGAVIVVDAAQWVSQEKIDVKKWNIDFLAFSSHKLFGPTGIGALYGKKQLLDAMPPYQGGGNMIATVTFEKTTYNDVPFRFEAGTPHIAGAIGTAAAIDFFSKIDLGDIRTYELELLQKATEKLQSIEGIKILGTATKKAPILSFNLKGVHPSDVGLVLDQQGVAVRTGHHCTQPLMQRFDIPGTVRASFSIYNNLEDVDRLYQAVLKAKEFLT
ncbi:MAG: SufS family cysteine desulfurase [Bdellovibrionota bacterium]